MLKVADMIVGADDYCADGILSTLRFKSLLVTIINPFANNPIRCQWHEEVLQREFDKMLGQGVIQA